jgi:hypothetical protein
LCIVHTVTVIYVQVKNAKGFTLDIEKDPELFYMMDPCLLGLLSDIHSPSYTYWNQARTPERSHLVAVKPTYYAEEEV